MAPQPRNSPVGADARPAPPFSRPPTSPTASRSIPPGFVQPSFDRPPAPPQPYQYYQSSPPSQNELPPPLPNPNAPPFWRPPVSRLPHHLLPHPPPPHPAPPFGPARPPPPLPRRSSEAANLTEPFQPPLPQPFAGPRLPPLVPRAGFQQQRGGPPRFFPPPQQQQHWRGTPQEWIMEQQFEHMLIEQRMMGRAIRYQQGVAGWKGTVGGPINAFASQGNGSDPQQSGYTGARPGLVTFNGFPPNFRPPPDPHYQFRPSSELQHALSSPSHPPPPADAPEFAFLTPRVPPLPSAASFWRDVVAAQPGQAEAPVYRSKAMKISNGPVETKAVLPPATKKEERGGSGKLLPPASSLSHEKDFPPPSGSSSSVPSANSSSHRSEPSTAVSSPARVEANVRCHKENISVEARISARVLDRYVEPFVPHFLHSLQHEPPQFLHPLPALPPFPPPDYSNAFLPQPLFLLPPPAPDEYLLSMPPSSPPNVQDLPSLEDWYQERWRTLLGWELESLGADLGKLVLWKLHISIVDHERAEYKIFVPGIRENHPKVEVGDVALLREVYLNLDSGGTDGFQGRVVGLRKRDGFIHIQVPHLWPILCNEYRPIEKQQAFLASPTSPGTVVPTHFNVTFKLNATPSVTMFDAVTTLSKSLTSDNWYTSVQGKGMKVIAGNDLARRWLFPTETDLSGEQKTGMLGDPMQWFDENLNEEQKNAVTSIALKLSRVPYLIQGSFGTGKTKSIVEAVLQILRCQPDATILLCAPSNSAADTLALRLRKHLKLSSEMLRLNDRERTFAEVPDVLLPYCHIDADHFGIPPFAQLMSYRLVLSSCLDAAILVRARLTNRDLGSLEASTSGTIHRNRTIEPHWTHLLIDEAGQGSEPELLVPISVILPYQGSKPKVEPQLCLVGDPLQLGPILTSEASRQGELDVSLLERLFERPIYSSKTKVSPRKFTHLTKNYRCHPALLMTPSALFYGDSIEPAAKNGRVSWTEMPDESLPFAFFQTVGDEEMVDEHASWYNETEGDRVVAICRSLLDEGPNCSPPLKAHEIGVQTPFREQVWRIREKLRRAKMGSVDVGSVEDYQGRESRITIVSTVRSRERFLDEDKKKGLGLVFEQKRFNVAITRAKELLIIVGNASLLSKDPFWSALLAFALRNKLFVGPKPEGLHPTNAYISRLESSYINARRPKQIEDEDEDEDEAGAALSGAMAREAMREEEE